MTRITTMLIARLHESVAGSQFMAADVPICGGDGLERADAVLTTVKVRQDISAILDLGPQKRRRLILDLVSASDLRRDGRI